MLYKITNKHNNLSYITDSEADTDTKLIDDSFKVEFIMTKLSMREYIFFDNISKKIDSALINVNSACGAIQETVEKYPTDTEIDAERLQVADDSVSALKDLERVINNLLGKNID